MDTDRPFHFDPFRLDPRDARLFRGSEPVPLTPKAFAVLHFLLRHAGRLVTKEELINAVWDDAHVSDASLKVCVREIRQALGDDAREPRFVETVHRRGYRFVGAPVAPAARRAEPAPPVEPVPAAEPLVGRGAELARFDALLVAARRGERQVVFLTGEAGTGKTALVGELVRRAAASGAWTAVGQCFEQFGTGEPFLPVLEALSHLCRDPRRARFVELLGTHAPTWLVQMPWLRTTAGRDGAVELVPGLTEPLQRADVCGWAAYWNLLWRGWSADDAAACAGAVDAARHAGDRARLGPHLGRYSYFLSLQARYGEADRAAEAATGLALEAGDASEYLLAHFFRAWALLHAGRWGELLDVLRAGTETADKNGHRPWALFLRLELAWVHQLAGDHDTARALGGEALREAEELNLGYGEAFASVVLGFAHLGTGDARESLRALERAARVLDAGRSVMAWVWRMPLHLGLSECRLALGDPVGARSEAEALCAAAARSGERTYAALGRGALAEAERAAGRGDVARALLDETLARVDATVPLAALGAYRTSDRFAPEPTDGGHSPSRTDTVRRALALTIGEAHSLREYLLRPPAP